MRKKFLEGKLFLHSEQGMEGGYLSIQDIEFFNLFEPKFGVTENRKVWDKSDPSKYGITSNPEIYLNNSWLPWPDPIVHEPDYQISSLYRGEERGDFNADKRLMNKYKFKLKYTKEKANEIYGEGNWKFLKPPSDIILKDGSKVMMGGTPNSIPKRPYGISKDGLTRVSVKWNDGTLEKERLSNTLLVEGWSYEGLHKLKETDILKVIDPISKNIICEGQINLIPLRIFSQTMKGHFEKVNQKVDDRSNWEKYFNEKYYAELYREIK